MTLLDGCGKGSGWVWVTQQNIVIMKEREAPLNYQISVSNVTRIASKSMADFYILFSSQASSQQWKSPIVHGKVTKENTRFPWTFISDTHQFTVTFHELDGGVDKRVGSMPLLLMRREGQEQFLIFGCTEANRGRKVAEIDFTYMQCSAAVSLPSNPSGEQSKRVSLEYTIQVENYDNKKQLNMIPEEPEPSLNKQSNPNIKLPEQSFVDDFHPSRLQTLKIESNRPRMSEDSNFQLNLIRQMQDATDRWYRNNFGKEKLFDLQHLDIEDSRLAVVRYERSFEYLNELSYTSPHIQLKNLMILTEKLPQTVEVYCIDLDGSQLLKHKVASMEVEGHRYNWPNAVRLPKDKKAYGLQVVTADKERLQGVIIKDSNSKHVMEIYNKNGKAVGKANYTLKQIKKIEIQTMEIMQLNPITQNQKEGVSEKESSNELDKSFLKTANNRSLINELTKNDNQPSFREKYKLIKEIYLNRSRQEPIQQPIQQQIRPIQRDLMVPPPRRQMTNHAYLQQPQLPYQKPKNFRKNKFQLDPSQSHSQPRSQPHSQSHNQQHSLPHQSRQLQLKSTITQIPVIQFPTPIYPKTTKSNQQQVYVSPSSGNSANQSLPENSREQSQDKPVDEPEPEINKRIQQLKKIGSAIGKKAKAFPSKKFTKNAKYKTVIYDQDEQQREWEAKRSKEHSDSGKQQQTLKKSYRQPINASNSFIPINATPSFQSLLINNTFSNDIKNSKPVRKNNTQIQIKKQTQQPQKPNNIITALNSSGASVPQLNDDSEQIPIMRHKTADQNVLKAMILQKQDEINKKKNSNKAVQEKKASQLGVNTERMSIVPNVLQSSVAPTPTTPTQKRQSPQLQDLKSIQYYDWQGKRSSKEDVGSMRQSGLRHSRQTKFSSQTIQPSTQMQAGKMNFLITSISISYYQNCFGSKFVKVYVPNRHYYETSHSTTATNFFWKCSGFLFSKIHQHQDIYLQLINSDGNDQRMVGRLILNSTQFKPGVEQAVIRAYLVLQNKIVGEVVVGYQTVGKARQVEVQGKRETVSLQHARYPKQLKESTTPIKRAKKPKRKEKTLKDSLTNFLRQHRKEKINRYILNQYSRAHIDSRITPSVPKKYTAGKNIVIGRNIRFPLTVEQQHHTVVPGPGAYTQLSQFQRYK